MNAVSILIAPDKFKGTLTAAEVAESIHAGIAARGGDKVRCTILPLADGGDGTVDAACAAGYERLPLMLTGPDGALHSTTIAFDGHTAVIEVARICGLSALPPSERRPLEATSRGVGEAIRYAAEVLAAQRVIIGLGGSATTDGGAGMLHALGARFIDRRGNELTPRAGALNDLDRVDMSGLLPLSGVEILGASDVDNTLHGPHGAAAVFAPQKGAGLQDVDSLERSLVHFAHLTDDERRLADKPGAGSAGGLGYGVLLLGGALTSGAHFVLDLLDFRRHAAAADFIVTGEGRLDAQTGRGKLVATVAQRAGGAKTIAVVGTSALTLDESSFLGLSGVYAIADHTVADTSSDPTTSAHILRSIGEELIDAIIDLPDKPPRTGESGGASSREVPPDTERMVEDARRSTSDSTPRHGRRQRVFPRFTKLDIEVNGVRLRGRVGPNPHKPPLLLLHGHPETHVMWHRVAPALADDFFIVAPDLRGYGDSERPAHSDDHAAYSKREMARDCVELMRKLGHERFFVAGHDRGARVAARLAADAPESIIRAMLLDIAPTLDMYEGTDRAFATAYWHWFFLIQPAPFPETLIGANPRAYVEGVMGARHAGLAPFPPEVLAQYAAGFTGIERARGACEDYRAAATIDLEHDRLDRAEGRRIEPPLRVLWARHGVIERLFRPLELWSSVAHTVSGRAIDSGHYIPEERPEEVVAEMRAFFVSTTAGFDSTER